LGIGYPIGLYRGLLSLTMYIGSPPNYLYGYTHTMNNDPYNHIEIIRGKPYRYDPDFDAYYRLQEQEGPVSKYAWIVLCILLAIAAFCLEYHPGLV
jgi:hypothetical protein